MAGEADTPIPGGPIPGGVVPNAVVEERKKQMEAEAARARAAARPIPIAMQRPAPVGLQEEQAASGPALSIPYRLPSAGLFYQGFAQGHDGTIIIAPTRGEHEEVLAGAVDKPEVQLGILRHITSQCLGLRGIPYNELLLLDWTAAMLHFLALSTGSDMVNLPAGKHACGAENDYSRALTELPHTVLRLREAGLPSAPKPVEPSAEEAFLRSLDAAEQGKEPSPETVRYLSAEELAEPFTTKPLPMTKEVIAWRFHRVHDLIKAEEFVAQVGDSNVSVGGKMFTFLLAQQIVAINGRPVSRLEAVAWVRRQPTPVLNALRLQIKEAEFGYDVKPKFKCKGCGGEIRMEVRLDAELFRPAALS